MSTQDSISPIKSLERRLWKWRRKKKDDSVKWRVQSFKQKHFPSRRLIVIHLYQSLELIRIFDIRKQQDSTTDRAEWFKIDCARTSFL